MSQRHPSHLSFDSEQTLPEQTLRGNRAGPYLLTCDPKARSNAERLSSYHWQCQWNSLCQWRNSDVSHSTAFHDEVEFYFSKSFRRSIRTVRTQALPISREIKQVLFPTTSWLSHQGSSPRQVTRVFSEKSFSSCFRTEQISLFILFIIFSFWKFINFHYFRTWQKESSLRRKILVFSPFYDQCWAGSRSMDRGSPILW